MGGRDINRSALEASGEPLVTVVIPTRDRLPSLKTAVWSALAQDNVALEVVVVDDGSEERVDENLNIADARLRVVRIDPPGGPANARERGVSEARGSVIAFLDDDDYWLPEKLERSLAYFQQFPEAGVVFHQTGRSTGSLAMVGVTYHEDPIARMLRGQPPSLDGVLVKKSVHRQVGFDPQFAGAEDLDYLIGLAKMTPMVEIHEKFAVIGDSPRTSFVAVEQRLQGRQRLRQKYPDLFADRRALAFWYLRCGHLNRVGGHRVRSVFAFVRSALLHPTAAAWKGMALAVTPKKFADPILARRRTSA